MLRSVLAPSLFAAAVLISAPAGAQEEDPALRACGETFQACSARCESSYPDDQAAEAGCEAACAADRAVCEAKTGYEQAKPWVADQFRKMQRFFDGFSEKGRSEPPPTSRPEPLLPPPEEPARPGEGRGAVDL